MRGGGGVSRVTTSPSSLRSPPCMIAACWWHAACTVAVRWGRRSSLAAVLHNDHSLPLDHPGIALAESSPGASAGACGATTRIFRTLDRTLELHGPRCSNDIRILHNDGCCMQHRLLFIYAFVMRIWDSG